MSQAYSFAQVKGFAMRHDMIRTKKRLVEVLGLVSCFWLCSAEANLIIPKGAEKASEVQPESFESYQIRILRNQNQIQAEKIKALREELLETSQKLHDLKPQLFNKGDPADQERIADLTIQLGQKEEVLNRLSSSRRDMETELSHARKKLTELDTIKDALTAMVEKQRTAKEQNAQNYKTQIEEMRFSAEAERTALQNKIAQHEAQAERLKQAVADKHKTVQRLDAIANAQDETLSQKQRELLALENKALSLYDEILATTEAFSAIHAQKDSHINDLTNALGQEKQKTRELADYKEEMRWLSDLSITTQTAMGKEIRTLKDELEQEKAINAELAIAKAQLEQRRQELAILTASHSDHRHEMEALTTRLKNDLNGQQLRTEVLQNQFLGILAHQEASHYYAETLEGMVGDLDQLLEAKNQELATTNVANTQATGNLLLQLDQAQTSLEQHKGYREALESYLSLLEKQHYVTTNANEANREKMAQGHTELYKTWQERLAKVQELQEQKEEELKTQLEQALSTGSAHQSRADNAEALLNESTQKIQNLNQELEARHNLIAQKEEQLKNLEVAQAALYVETDQRFKTLAANLEQEQLHTANLESLLENASNQIDQLEQQSSKKSSDIEKLQISHVTAYMEWTDQIVELQAELDAQQRKTQAIINRSSQDIAETERQLSEQLAVTERQLAVTERQLTENLAATERQFSDQLAATEHKLAVRDEQFTNLNLAHDYVKRELSQKISHIEDQLSHEKQNAENLQEQIILALAQVELEQSVGFEQSVKAKQLAKELEEKLQLLALSQTQTSTTDYDNQQLVRQNETLLREISALEQKLAAEQDKSHSHVTLVDQLRNDLGESEKQVQTIESLQRQVQKLEQAVSQHHAELEKERSSHQETKNAHASKLGDLESYHSANLKGRETGIAQLQEALRSERESTERLRDDLKLSRKNYHQEHSSLRNLEEIISKVQTRSEAMEDQLADARLALSASKDEIRLLSEAQHELMDHISMKTDSVNHEIDTERLARKNLQEQLDKALGLYESSLRRNEELELVNHSLNEEARQTLALKDDILNASQHNLDLQAQLENLQRRLDDAERLIADNTHPSRDQDEHYQNDEEGSSRLQRVNQIKSVR